MTIVTTATSSGPYTAVAQTTFAVDFYATAADEIEITLGDVVVSPSLYVFSRDDDGTGQVVFLSAVTGEVIIYSKPDFDQQTNFQRFGVFYPDLLNGPLDKAAAKSLYLKARVDILFPEAARTVAGRAGYYLAFDAGGIATTASGTGADAALRTDLAAGASGASLVAQTYTGTGGVTETVSTALRRLPSVKVRGATMDGVTNDTAAFTNEITAQATGHTTVPLGTTRVSAVLSDSVSIRGFGFGSILKANGTDTVLGFGYVNTPTQWAKRFAENFTIDGNLQASDGIAYRSAAATEVSGKMSLRNLAIIQCRRGIYKPTGNIGNSYYDLTIRFCDYGYYAVSQAAPLMHAGNDTFINCEIDYCDLAAIYISSTASGTGGTAIRDTIIQFNYGFGIFVYEWADSFTPLIMDGVWFEQNHSSANVTINAVVYTPRDIYLRNTAFAILSNGRVPEIELVNSHLLIQNCTADTDSVYVIDSLSTIYTENVAFNGGQHPIIVRSVIRADRELGNFSQTFRAEPRRMVQGGSPEGTMLYVETFAKASVNVTGTATVAGTVVADGRTFDSCQEFVLPVSSAEQTGGGTLVLNKWYVATLDLKHVAGTIAQFQVSLANGVAMAQMSGLLTSGPWLTLATIGKCTNPGTVALYMTNGAAGTQTVRLGAFQIIQFDTERAALEYYNSGIFAKSLGMREIYASAAPTTGTWDANDRAWNTAPAAAGVPGWVCVTGGSPGTWKAMGVLAA